MKKGKVTLIGAGPGDKGLITLKGLDALKSCDVIVYDRLVSDDIMSLGNEKAELINVGKVMNHHNIPQPEINKILLEKALEGKNVVRLKGGDPFVFGRGGEELELLVENNVEYEVIPGITSAISALAYAGIPATHRDFSSSIHLITGHAKEGSVEYIDYKSLVGTKGTLIFYMGVSTLDQIVKGLLDAGMDKDMPCAAVENGTRYNQRTLYSTLSQMVKDAENFQLRSPAVIAFGKVCSLNNKFEWYEKTKLFGKKVIVTRPFLSNNVLTSKLKSQGVDVVDYPCVKIDELNDKTSLHNAVKNLKDYKVILFASKNSVIYFFKELINLGYDGRNLSHLTIGCIGNISYNELKKYGILCDFMSKDNSNESMAETLKEKGVSGKILCIEGELESLSLSKAVQEAGFSVDGVAAYISEFLDWKYYIPLNELIEKNVMAAFTSSAAVYGFIHGGKPADISKVTAVCIGSQTYKTAKNAGMNAVMAEKPTIDSLIEKLGETGE